MESVLVIVTLLSGAAAAVALTSLRRVQRREQDRSDARVAALAAAADDDLPSPESRIPATESRLSDSSGTFFGTVQRGEATTGRLPLFAAAGLIVLLGAAFIFLQATGDREGATAVQSVRSVPLELVSLGHERDVKTLTIKGTVRNPALGAKLEDLTAVVSLLDAGGGLISTKDVPLDYRALRPGEEAPFKVNVPDPGSIARYRVSFRAGTAVVPHVDRRMDSKLASALR
jgi:hypothetical protein